MVISATDAMRRAVRMYPDRLAVTDGRCHLTYRDVFTEGCRLANALRAWGVRARDAVATLEKNNLDCAVSYVGLTAGDYVRVGLYPDLSIEAHEHMLRASGTKLLLVDEVYATPEILQLPDVVDTLDQVIVRDATYREAVGAASGDDPKPTIDPADIHVVRFSGGSTGFPKAVPSSHRDWMRQLRDAAYELPKMQTGDVFLHVGPVSHASGFLFIPVLMHGGVNYLYEGRFDGERIAELLDTADIAYVFLAPLMLAEVARSRAAERGDFPSLKALWVAGAPVAEATARRCLEVFGERVYQGYGVTEAGLVAAMPPNEWHAEIPGSDPIHAAGKVATWSEVAIWDDNGKALPIGEVGEIVVRRDGQMKGYMGDPTLNDGKLDRGWVRTGDVGRLDTNGFVYIVDRKGSMIISGGHNIWPAELERVIAQLSGVLEVGVVAIPHERWGETPLAVCVVEQGSTVTPDEIIQVCRRRLGSYKKPGRVVLQTTPLPRTSVDKIDRKAISEPYWSAHDRRVAGT